jgi:hypothetical protein
MLTPSKNKENRESGLQKARKFFDVYYQFDEWLSNIGFLIQQNFNMNFLKVEEFLNPTFHKYCYKSNYIVSLWGFESYNHKFLNHEIHFIRDRNEHKIMFIEFCSVSDILSLDQAKEFILNNVRKLRD